MTREDVADGVVDGDKVDPLGLRGKVIRFKYPSLNWRSMNAPMKLRRMRVTEVRDIISTPLAFVTSIMNPEVRRGRLLLNGEDCDALKEKSYYLDSMTELEVFDPETDREWSVIEIDLGPGPAGVECFDRDDELSDFRVIGLVGRDLTEPEADATADAFNKLSRMMKSMHRAIVQPTDSSLVMRLMDADAA